MQQSVISGLMQYEKDFLMFQKELHLLRQCEPDKFVAFKNGAIVSTGFSIDEVKKDLDSKGIEPSETVIEFVSRKEIKVIV